MTYLYLDLETIPTQSPEVRAQIAETVTPPGNISKAETIAAWETDKKPGLIKDAIAKTALDGSVGHICCIGWAVGDQLADFTCHSDVSGEATIIRDFMSAANDLVTREMLPTVIVGHNVINFDIRFLWQRAIVLGVKMPAWFPRDPKPWGDDVFDTMLAFAGQRGTIGMDRLCRALGLPGKDDIDGSMIGRLWEAGEYDRISEYCRGDIERTRQIHKRMMIAYGEAA